MCLIFKELNKFERNKKKHTNDSDADYAQWNKHDKKCAKPISTYLKNWVKWHYLMYISIQRTTICPQIN